MIIYFQAPKSLTLEIDARRLSARALRASAVENKHRELQGAWLVVRFAESANTQLYPTLAKGAHAGSGQNVYDEAAPGRVKVRVNMERA